MKFQTSLLHNSFQLINHPSSGWFFSPPPWTHQDRLPDEIRARSLIKSKRDIGKRLRAGYGISVKYRSKSSNSSRFGGGKVFWELWRVVRWLVPAGWYEAGPHSVINYNRRSPYPSIRDIEVCAPKLFLARSCVVVHEGLTRLRVRT